MFLKNKTNGEMVEIIETSDLTNLFNRTVLGSYQAGEEKPEPEEFNKADLVFLSGEDLPKCWTDPEYRTVRKV
ncbi:MAG: acetyltransferase [Aliivibrio sp.]|uniref:acetyltransferase n=1 Tax=Aliivibrio sp. TaxID=1872443 RepID=UPI001A4D43CC|nr:acetyltransferase [Aliivibrio sp.]